MAVKKTLIFVGHVCRMSENRLPKRYCCISGRRMNFAWIYRNKKRTGKKQLQRIGNNRIKSFWK